MLSGLPAACELRVIGVASGKVVSDLTAAENRIMKLSLKLHHLKRYQEIARLFWKYGDSELAREFEEPGFQDQTGAAGDRSGNSKPEELADDLEKMGPTFIKFGQLLSSRPDLLPEPYLKALTRLQDKVKPFPLEEVEQIVASELGVRISKAFAFFDEKHLAAASLGQVHVAALRDGRAVVVKVQRPEIRRQIALDFEVLEEIAGFLDQHTDAGRRYRFGKILAEFKSTLLQELDYQREAANLLTLAEILRRRMFQAGTPGNLLGSLLEMKDFIGGLPGRVNKILDTVGNAELDIQVRTPDARHLLRGFEKIANRVTPGIILAALIVGAAWLMRVNSPFQSWGSPGVARASTAPVRVGPVTDLK